jgi:hypothetical protein
MPNKISTNQPNIKLIWTAMKEFSHFPAIAYFHGREQLGENRMALKLDIAFWDYDRTRALAQGP